MKHHLVVNGLRIHYLEQGQGTPLILLHGTAIDSAHLSYGPSISVFAQHFRVIAPDWPGYGESEYPRRALSIQDYVDLLKGLVEQLKLKDFHLLGFSMGGAVALSYALNHSLRSLTLVSSYGLGKWVHIPFLPFIALRVPTLAASILTGLRLSKPLTGLVLRYLIFARPSLATPALIDEVYVQLKKPYVEEAFMKWIQGEVGLRYFRSNFQQKLSSLNLPTLLLHGSRDLVIPSVYARKASEKIPHAKLYVIPHCGHWVMREQTQIFQEQTLAFLQTNNSN